MVELMFDGVYGTYTGGQYLNFLFQKGSDFCSELAYFHPFYCTKEMFKRRNGKYKVDGDRITGEVKLDRGKYSFEGIITKSSLELKVKIMGDVIHQSMKYYHHPEFVKDYVNMDLVNLYDSDDPDVVSRHLNKFCRVRIGSMAESGPSMYDMASMMGNRTFIPMSSLTCLPDKNRNYYMFVTNSMSKRPMNAPDKTLQYAELLIKLPPDWNIDGDGIEERWPRLRLHELAKFPFNDNTWLGHGHTAGDADAFLARIIYPGTNFQAMMLLKPNEPDEFCRIFLNDGKIINLYTVILVYLDEVLFYQKYETTPLTYLMEKSGMSDILDLKRISIMTYVKKNPQVVKELGLDRR